MSSRIIAIICIWLCICIGCISVPNSKFYSHFSTCEQHVAKKKKRFRGFFAESRLSFDLASVIYRLHFVSMLLNYSRTMHLDRAIIIENCLATVDPRRSVYSYSTSTSTSTRQFEAILDGGFVPSSIIPIILSGGIARSQQLQARYRQSLIILDDRVCGFYIILGCRLSLTV